MPRADDPTRRFTATDAPSGSAITAAMVREFGQDKEAILTLPKPPSLKLTQAVKPIPSLAQSVMKAPSVEVGATPALKAIHTSAEATSRAQARVNAPARADVSATRGAATNR